TDAVHKRREGVREPLDGRRGHAGEPDGRRPAAVHGYADPHANRDRHDLPSPLGEKFMGTIPANLLVNVQPSVLNASVSALHLVCLRLSSDARIPTGVGLSFPEGDSVTDYFGAGSAPDLFANGGINGSGISMGAGYFGGYTNSTKRPGALLMSRYNTA